MMPRVWWIGVGSLTMAPDHTPGSTRNTLSRVISSYTPTIKTLSYARQKKPTLHGPPAPRILLVTMPTAPDTSSTPVVPGNTYIRGASTSFSKSAIPGTPPIKWASLPNPGQEVGCRTGRVCSQHDQTGRPKSHPSPRSAPTPQHHPFHLPRGIQLPHSLGHSPRWIIPETPVSDISQRCADRTLVRVLHDGQSSRTNRSSDFLLAGACDTLAVG